MAEWQNGRMAEWQNGRMAEWQNGRMAEAGLFLPSLYQALILLQHTTSMVRTKKIISVVQIAKSHQIQTGGYRWWIYLSFTEHTHLLKSIRKSFLVECVK
ncbi:hypothetical protein BZ20_1567 [Yersinia pseudotuberculosis]|nr:hypothetical protein BZ20_1567 [Yersinia pseudotuberculosis]